MLMKEKVSDPWPLAFHSGPCELPLAGRFFAVVYDFELVVSLFRAFFPTVFMSLSGHRILEHGTMEPRFIRL